MTARTFIIICIPGNEDVDASTMQDIHRIKVLSKEITDGEKFLEEKEQVGHDIREELSTPIHTYTHLYTPIHSYTLL